MKTGNLQVTKSTGVQDAQVCGAGDMTNESVR